MPYTTIQITTETKKKLDSLKEYRRETYNDVINRLIPEKTKTQKHKKTEETKTTTPQTNKTQQTNPYEETEY